MRILFFDLDTLRSDHLGCYGYKRNTSPNIDNIAKQGVVFDRYYCPNAPCLPSRASLASGVFGIRNGVLGHGGTAADMRLEGENRGFRSTFSQTNLFQQFRYAGFKTASISTFAERHSAYWFYAGFNECYNVGKGGMESAEEVMPLVRSWLNKNAESDNWLLHINLWDSHTPYRAPLSYGRPFENVPLSDDWIDDDIFKEHLSHIGPHGANEINMWDDKTNPKFPRHPGKLSSLSDVKKFIDDYDTGIKYMDDCIGEILSILKNKGVDLEDLAIIITSDHGENMGELGIYGEHATADEPTCHIPMIIKWPEMKKGIRDSSIHTNCDLAPTICDIFGLKKSADYDGKSFYPTLKEGKICGDDKAVLTQCAHVCQRSALFGDYLYISTLHGGGHLFDKDMLFNIKNDPHQQKNLADKLPDKVNEGKAIIRDWETAQLQKTSDDPMYTVIKEGGPLHYKGALKGYIKRLEDGGRADDAKKLKDKYNVKD